jgi:hypothetical protein
MDKHLSLFCWGMFDGENHAIKLFLLSLKYAKVFVPVRFILHWSKLFLEKIDYDLKSVKDKHLCLFWCREYDGEKVWNKSFLSVIDDP